MENTKHDRECTDCDLATDERLNYFTGQFLAERDFRAEQEYQIGKHRQHNRYLHGYGTVCGLKIVEHPNPKCQDRFVILEPGLALDCCGREIVVKEKVYIDLVKLFAAQNIDLNSNIDPKEKNHLLFSLCYEECKTEFVPALYSECGCDEFGCDANRIVEGFGIKLQLLKDLPKPLHEEPDGVSVEWKNTINLAQPARLALDSVGKKLYVLNAANPSQIMVYDTNNYALLRSIDVGATGVDLAVAPDGKHLYIIRDKITPETDNCFLQVLNVENSITPPTTVNTFPLGTTPLDLSHLPQLLVAADGKVYTLDPKLRKVKIWKTDINTAGTTEAKAKYTEIETDTEPRSIAVSSDGIWLFIAEVADADRHIKAAKIANLSSASQEIKQISITDKPLLIAVSGNSQKLYTVTAAKKLRAFSIQESPTFFPEIGTPGGIDLGAEEPIAITVSQSGKWVYLLSKDSVTAKGNIKIIDGGKISTDPTHAIPVAVVSDPQDMLLDLESNNLYVAGKGSTTAPPYGGVSILNVQETQCSEVIWKALDGCPECPDDNCIPLAIVENYVKNEKITNDRIENRKYRPLVTSTETLKQLVMCALETGGGTKGKDGSQGLPGNDGTPGLGLNPNLPKILDIKWTHGSETPWDIFEQMKYDANPNETSNNENHFLTIYFDREMAKIDRQTFKVWIDYPGIESFFSDNLDANIVRVFALLGIYNVLNLRDQNGKTLFNAALPLPLYGKIIPLPDSRTTPHTREISPWAVTFVPHKNVFSLILIVLLVVSAARQKLGVEEVELPSVHVLLKGDFIGTTNSFDLEGKLLKENGILDADNIGGQVGRDRNRGGIIRGGKNPSGDLVSGGDFESWFFLQELPANQLQGAALREMILASPFSELGINLADLIQPQ